jgi:uncharacterized membrane protein
MQENCVRPVYSHSLRSVQRNILAGIITIGPLIVTYLIFSFLLGLLAKVGLPIVWILEAIFPGEWQPQPWVQFVLSILLTLLVLYLVGRVTSEVVGRQAFKWFESALDRLPFVAKIYNSVRKLIDTMMAKDDSVQRVVLVEFPMPGQRSLGFLTRTLIDSSSGQLLAAVLLPNAINPMSGLLQIMPMDRIVETSLTMEQAMSMLMTGGTVGPEEILFTRPVVPAEKVTELVSVRPDEVHPGIPPGEEKIAFADLDDQMPPLAETEGI